jgi:hypothetical protein
MMSAYSAAEESFHAVDATASDGLHYMLLRLAVEAAELTLCAATNGQSTGRITASYS